MLREILAAGSAWILDCRTFSNVSVTISFEMEQASLASVLEKLGSEGLAFDGSSHEMLKSAGQGAGVIACSLQVTFVHMERDQCDFVSPFSG